jgi:pilus assembly protein Flp/PilA
VKKRKDEQFELKSSAQLSRMKSAAPGHERRANARGSSSEGSAVNWTEVNFIRAASPRSERLYQARKRSRKSAYSPNRINSKEACGHYLFAREYHEQNGASVMLINSLKTFVGNESGATAIEYALIASLIAVALVTILTNLGTKLSSEFNEISGVLK